MKNYNNLKMFIYKFKIKYIFILFILKIAFITTPVFAEINLSEKERQWIMDNPVVIFTGNPNWLPYEAFDDKGNYIGIVADHLKIISDKTGLEFRMNPSKTWAESVNKAKSNTVDVLSETDDSDLSSHLNFTIPYISSRIVIVMSNKENYAESIDKIKNKKIALIKKHSYTSKIRRKFSNINFITVDDIHEGLISVSTGKVDALLCTLALCSYTILDLGLNNVRIIGTTEFDTKLAFGVQKNKPELLSILNKSIKKISKKQQQIILDNWINVKLVDKTDRHLIVKISLVSIVIFLVVIFWNRRLSQEILKRIKAEKKNKMISDTLFESELWMRSIFNSLDEAVLVVGVDRKVIQVNDATLKMFGYSIEEIAGQSTEMFHVDHEHYIEFGKKINQFFNEQRNADFEFRAKRKNGEIFSSEHTVSFLKMPDGESVGIVSVIKDITEKKKSILALEKSEERYHIIAKVSPVGIFRTDLWGEYIYVNERWCELADMTEDSAFNDGWVNALHPEDRERVFNEWGKVIEENIKFKTECRFLHPNGKVTWLLAEAEAEYDMNDNIIGYVGAITDITDRKLVELALEESETLLEKAQKIAKIGYWKLKPVTGEVTGSDELFHIFGFSRKQASLEKFLDVVHPDDREMEVAAIQRGVEHGESWDIEHRLICDDRTEKWVHAIGKAIKDDNGKVIELLGTVQDITKEKLIDLELEQSSRRFKAMFESITDAIVYADPERKIRMVNQAAIKLFGYEEVELQGNLTKMLYASYDEFKQQGIKHYNPNSKNETSTKVITYKCKNGNEFPGETLGVAVRTSADEVMGYLGIIRDITERTLMESELESYRETLESQIEKRTSELVKARNDAERANKAKSEFLSSMSHELRTPLNAILGFGQMLELDESELSDIQNTNVKEILDAGHHLLNLINEVLNLAQIEAGKLDINMEKVDFTKVLQECMKLMSTSIEGRNIEVIDNVSDHHYFINADFMRLKQILLNLISNAVKYNKESGRLIFDSRLINNHRIRICITDTGEGLTEDEIVRLFNPFERLNVKENIQGTGIGLTITKHLSELMFGSIGVKSMPGNGSTFWVELALFQDPGRYL